MHKNQPDGILEQPVPGPRLLVSLGLPVYNGCNFLRQALDSILAQTYPAWELILSDNGSTDATPDICAEFAARDGRIRFYRHRVNMGASRNFNFVFTMARGPLFRWTAHDDICEPALIERCVAGLSAHPAAVLCHPRTRVIGPSGETLYDENLKLRTDSNDVRERYKDLICLDHACFPIFGIIRSDLLRRTPLLGAFVGSDRNLLAELALHGPFHEVPEILFLRRDHPNTSTRQYPVASARLAWFKDSSHSARYPTLRRAYGYLSSLARAPLTARERLACLGGLVEWSWQRFASFLHGLRAPAVAILGGFRPGREGGCLPLPKPQALTTDSTPAL